MRIFIINGTNSSVALPFPPLIDRLMNESQSIIQTYSIRLKDSDYNYILLNLIFLLMLMFTIVSCLKSLSKK